MVVEVSEPYNILVIDDGGQKSRLSGYLRSHCGKHIGEVRCIESESQFIAALDEREWDIVLSSANTKGLSAVDALRITNRRGLDLPHIVVSDGQDDSLLMDLLYAGAEHVVSWDEIERLCITVPRSIANARRRREVAHELMAHRRHLEQEVAARTAELEQLNNQLQKEVRERERVSRALRESERQYRYLFENVHDGICIIQDRTLQFVNRRLEEMLGFSAGTMVGTKFLDYSPPEERLSIQDVYRGIISGAEDMLESDTVLIKKNGQRIDVAVSASAIEYGGRRAVMVMVRDITERKRIDRMEKENEKLEAVGVVARGVGNNFANIMSVINSYAVSISDSFLPHTRPHDAARSILDATHHATDLTKRLLSVVQFSDSKGVRANLEAVSLTEVMDKALRMVEQKSKDIKVIIKKPKTLPNVIADKNQLLDTLISVFLNAMDAMPDGGTLAIKVIERKIARPRSNPNAPGGKFVGISIHDNGIGMTREEVSRVFEPFYTTKSSKNAFGLGLPVAQSMALSWGGWLDIRSRPGKGTRVRIFMPKSEDQSGTKQVAAGAKTRMNILVVDDNEGRRQMMVEALRESGHTVVEAADGDSAIELYRENSGAFDLCIVDWILPGTDGKGVLQSIFELDPQTKVIMVSGFSRDYVRSQVQIGAWGFLQKPFSVDELMCEIEKVCGAGVKSGR